MVWFLNKLAFSEFQSIDSEIFPTTNVLFNISRNDYDEYELYLLWRSGVNVINVDRTVHNEEFLNYVKAKVDFTRDLKFSDKDCYYKPLAISVTMSIKEPIDIDDKVDIIILKDILATDEIFRFRQKYNIPSITPILYWISADNLQILSLIIKASDGVVLDLFGNEKLVEEYCSCVLDLCRKACKPVICFSQQFENGYNNLPMAFRIAESRFDGIMISDDLNSKVEHTMVYNLVCSLRFVEEESTTVVNETFELKNEIKSPASIFLSIAISASLTALYSGAGAIVVLTTTGRSARWVSCARPHCPILAVTTRRATAHRLHVYRKVIPLVYEQASAINWHKEWQQRVHFGADFALKIRLVRNGAKLVVLTPSQQELGFCDTIQIITLPILYQLH